MGEYTQQNRLIQVATPLGEDVLLLQGFSGQEGVSQLFHFDLRMVSESRTIGFADIVGKAATVKVTLASGESRYINGIVASFAQGGNNQTFAFYQASLVPWLWFLTRTSDCRIFQNQSVPDIIAQIFSDFGFKDFSNRLRGSYAPREYCVQYRETAFNFISRLMEEEGIFYFFEHEEQKHTLVLADSPNEFKPSRLHPTVNYETVAGVEGEDDIITEWAQSAEVRPGKYTVCDYNFEQPMLDLTASVDGADTRKYEIYDFPGEYLTKDAGERLVGLRIQEEETPGTVITGASNCRGFVPGFRFELKEHYRRDFNKAYVVTSVYHTADEGMDYRSADDGSSNLTYTNSFQCIPHPTPFRPPRTTPIPLVHGSQTAIVTGPSGEEIYVDQYGRVKVQFHWDRHGKYDENTSCWVRVSQNWAGKRWGAMFHPRIGQEVIVDFIEGDPDRPIITGRVYNADSMPHYALPDEMTKSYIKSNSSKGGGGFNELRFEDKKGSEQLFLHAEKQQDNRVKADSLEFVGHDRHLIVKHDQFEKVENDQHLQVTGDSNQKIGGTLSVNVGSDEQKKVGQNYALDAGMEIHLKSGTNLVVETGTSLTLKVGGNFININSGGIFIKGTMVMLNSGGAAGSGAGASPDAPTDPKEADTGEPGAAAQMPPPKSPPVPPVYSPAALALLSAAQSGAPFCDI